MEDIKTLLNTKYDQLWNEVSFKLRALAWLKEQLSNKETYHSIYYDVSDIDTIQRMYLNYRLEHSELELPEDWTITVLPGYIQVYCANCDKNDENNPFN